MVDKDMVVSTFKTIFNLDVPREVYMTKGNCYWCQFVHASLASAFGIACLANVRPRKMFARGYRLTQLYLAVGAVFFFGISYGRFKRIGPPPSKEASA